MSPKKVRLVTDSIKGLAVDDALLRLRYLPKHSAPIITKLLKSAIANARHNNEIPEASLMVKTVMVNEAIALKRWRPAAFGSAHPLKKRGSHIKMVLGLKPGVEMPRAGKKRAAKPVPTAEASPSAEAHASSRSVAAEPTARSFRSSKKRRSGPAAGVKKSLQRTTSK